MKGQRASDQLAPVHEHRFVARNPYQPEGDRCECGMFRYELMGPLAKRKARMAAYGQPWPVFDQ